MSKRFENLKRKYLLGAILKSAVCGVAFALFTVGIILLALKLSAIGLGAAWYVLIGVAAAGLGFAVAFIFFRPTDKKVATRLDNEFGLEERVQTSLEYSGQKGTIVELQRADADEKLSDLPKRKPRFSKIWQYCVAVVVALAMAVTAFSIPAKQAAASVPDGDDAPADIGVLQIGMVEDMIRDVNKSSLAPTLKTATINKLQYLLDELNSGKLTQGGLRKVANETVESVDLLINEHTSYIIVGAALEAVGQTEFSSVVLKGGNSYKSYKPDDDYTIKEYKHVTAFNEVKFNRTSARMAAGLTELRNLLKVEIAEGLADAMTLMATSVTDALSTITVRDELYGSLSGFVIGINDLQRTVVSGESTDEEIQSDISRIFANNLTQELALCLSNQAYAGAMRRFMCNRLKYIFTLGNYELPDEEEVVDPGETDDPGKNPGTPPEGPGSEVGPGGNVYGSDDVVYDPFTKMYRPYGEILSDYQAMLEELINTGALTVEQAKMARDYFARLLGNSKD